MAEEVEDEVAPLVGLVGEMRLYELVDARAALIERFSQVGALVAELQLVEGQNRHGRGSQRLSDLVYPSYVRGRQLLVAVQETDLKD